jgi:hypothetical protein
MDMCPIPPLMGQMLGISVNSALWESSSVPISLTGSAALARYAERRRTSSTSCKSPSGVSLILRKELRSPDIFLELELLLSAPIDERAPERAFSKLLASRSKSDVSSRS